MYRTVECHIWDDSWFQELDPVGKLTFLYLLTNIRQTACGAFRITLRTMSVDLGCDHPSITEALDALERVGKVIWWAAEGVVWVRNFYKYQRANSSDKFRVSASRALKEFPPDVQNTVLIAYPELQVGGLPSNKEDTLSIPYQYPINRGRAETKAKTETKQNNNDDSRATEIDTETEVVVDVIAKTQPGTANMPTKYQDEIALRDYLVGQVGTLFRLPLTKAHVNKLNAWFEKNKHALTAESVDTGVSEAATYTAGDSADYALKVMLNEITDPNRPRYQHARSGGGTPKPASSTNGSGGGGGNARDDPARADMPQPGYSWEKNTDGTWRKHGIYDGRWNYGLESLAAVRERDKHEHDTYLKQRRSRTGALQTT